MRKILMLATVGLAACSSSPAAAPAPTTIAIASTTATSTTLPATTTTAAAPTTTVAPVTTTVSKAETAKSEALASYHRARATIRSCGVDPSTCDRASLTSSFTPEMARAYLAEIDGRLAASRISRPNTDPDLDYTVTELAAYYEVTDTVEIIECIVDGLIAITVRNGIEIILDDDVVGRRRKLTYRHVEGEWLWSASVLVGVFDPLTHNECPPRPS